MDAVRYWQKWCRLILTAHTAITAAIKNTPYNMKAPRRPAAVRCDGIVYAAHPLGTIYKMYGGEYHRRYFEQLLRLAYPKPSVKYPCPVRAGSALSVRQSRDATACTCCMRRHTGVPSTSLRIFRLFMIRIFSCAFRKKFSVHRSSRREISSRFTRMASMWN